jgi:hypothetical protein
MLKEEAINMKTLLIAGTIAVAACWVGYGVGHHHGVQEERRLWEATGIDDAAYAGRAAVVTLDNKPARPRFIRVFYRNPHSSAVSVTASEGLVKNNIPDPRVFRHYDHYPQ